MVRQFSLPRCPKCGSPMVTEVRFVGEKSKYILKCINYLCEYEEDKKNEYHK